MYNVNARDRRGVTGLVLAMRNNMVSTVRLLLACQTIKLDSTEKDTEWTGLHYACMYNNVDSVRLYLAHPACTKQIVTILDWKGETADMLASSRGH